MKTLAGLLSLSLLLSSSAFSDQHHHHSLTEEEVGSVHFTTSCSKDLEASFNRAVALLHSFQYEQTREAFGAIASRDPGCALAQWGIAMSYYHGLWGNSDMAAGRAALKKAQDVAASNPKTSPHDRAYIDALAEIYREDEKGGVAHAGAFEQRMANLQVAYPSDTEAAIFHALTLAITAPKTDKTFANQKKCGEILEPIFTEEPHHPGVAHYIIHCYDNPVLAEKGLGAARMYAKIAPGSAHANHMPSHIFTRVGLWDESIASNLKSAELATQAENTSLNGEARDQRLHAMDYLEYAYLQSGRVKQAQAVLSEMISLPPVKGLSLTGNYGAAAIPARLALELGNWKQAAALEPIPNQVPWAQAITWMAIGVGSSRSGNLERALQAQTMLATLRDQSAKTDPYWSNQIEVQRREIEAWITSKNGQHADAVQMMRSAAELEESMDKHAVTPGPIIPAREMLAALLAEKQPQDALAEYETVLKTAPGRFNALYGAATAAEAAGNKAAANRHFQKLTELAVGDERPELITAREKVAVSASK